MFSIDSIKCTGCDICAYACPEAAINLRNNVAGNISTFLQSVRNLFGDLSLWCCACSSTCE